MTFLGPIRSSSSKRRKGYRLIEHLWALLFRSVLLLIIRKKVNQTGSVFTALPFFSYDLSSWMKRALLNALHNSRVKKGSYSFDNIGRRRSDFLEGNELPRPFFYVQVS